MRAVAADFRSILDSHRIAAMDNRILTALPVYNEDAHLLEVLERVREFSSEILVIDDGSSDRTPELLSTQMDLQIVTHEPNRGYGAALCSSFRFAIEQGYDVLITIDCDGQHEPRLIPELANAMFPVGAEPFDMVSGSRYLSNTEGGSVPPADRRQINHQITKQMNELLDLRMTDAFCGFKAYRVEALEGLDITEFGYGMPLQLWIQIARLGWRMTEFPVPRIYLDEKRSFGGSLDDAKRRMAYYQDVIQAELSRAELAEVCGTEVSPPHVFPRDCDSR